MADLDGDGDAVADARDGEDDVLAGEGFAELGNGGGEGAFDDGEAGPDGIEEFFAGEDFAGVLEELSEEFEGFRFELDGAVGATQGVGEFIEFEAGERKDAVGWRGGAGLQVIERHGVSRL